MFPTSALAQLALATLLAVAAVQACAHPGGRLDPDERQRLRGELRQQLHEDRARLRAEHEERARLRAERHGETGGRGWRAGRWSDIAPGTPPMGGGPFGPATEGSMPPGSVENPAPPVTPPHRLSADEREQLRRQLREARFRQAP